jgi:flagellar export protein FliJ
VNLFRFRLQAVLTLRERAEQAAQQRCARSCAAVQLAAARLGSAEAEITASEELRRTHLAAGFRAGQFEQLRAHAVLLNERRIRLARELAEARQREAEARQSLVAATQQRETLVRLRDHQRRAYNYRAARAEQKVLDDLAARGMALAQAWRQPTTNV